LHGPYTRKIRVLSIGAGVTGIMNAYHIQKMLENVEHVIYEKNADIGGTWLENRYPGESKDLSVSPVVQIFRLPGCKNNRPRASHASSQAPCVWTLLIPAV
jgi:cation diffusion facilitator CzcD-associated flavoprotein CzcO